MPDVEDCQVAEHYERASLGRIVSEGSCALGEVTGEVARHLVDQELCGLGEEDHGRGCTARVRRLRAQYFTNRPTLCLHRARAVTGAYEATEGQATPIRRGHFFKAFCEQKPVVVQNDELIVGNPGCQIRSAFFGPDFCWEWLGEEERERLSAREQDPYIITDQQKKEIEELSPYWKGKSLYEWNLGHLPEETRRVSTHTGIIDVWIKQGVAMDHCAAGWSVYLFPVGFKGIRQRAQAAMAALTFDKPEDQERLEYLQGVLLACDGIRVLAHRYADEARRLAGLETDAVRVEELLTIAEVCEWVPWNPPRTFREALQSAWFALVGGAMEGGHLFMGGRLDQDLQPYYERDIAAGRITKDEAQELLECFFIKGAEIIYTQSEESAMYFSGYQAYMNACIGGVKRDGTSAVNDITYMLIQACADVRLPGAGIIARVNRRNPDEYVESLVGLARLGTGYPAMYGDDVGVPTMLSLGVPIEDALDYGVLGCSESHIPSKMWKYSDGGQLNMAAILEFALNDGYSRVLDNTGGRWGLATGDARRFSSYDQVAEAFRQQLAYFTQQICIVNMVAERAAMRLTQFPFISSLFEDCIAAGKDYTAGGCTYNVGPAPCYVGLADVANSLAAIRHLVFEDGVVAIGELIDALDNDFEGREDLRQLLITRGPKYGRDDECADAIARWVADLCHEEAAKYMSPRGVRFTSAMFPISAYVPLGQIVGALPSGRHATLPLADGVSPEANTDRSPTEVIKSVTSYDHVRHENGLLLNVRFSPSAVEGDEGLRKLAAVVRTFFERGGWHIQLNVIDSKTLRDAQAHPEKYTHLMVRVAGYSAYFSDLCREIQDSIIARTEHTIL